MAVDSETTGEVGGAAVERERRRAAARARPRRRWPARIGRFFGATVFSSLTRRIVILNLAGLAALVSGILYLNQFRAGLIDARVESLLTQGEIIAAAIAASATAEPSGITVDPDKLLQLQAGESMSVSEDDLSPLDFPINPERVAPILSRLISPTKTRARIYDRDGMMLLDSRHLYARGQILRFNPPPPDADGPSLLERLWQTAARFLSRSDLPIYKELAGNDGKGYPEVERALAGAPASVVRANEKGELVVSVAVPIQRFRTVLGALLLSTQGSDIEAILFAERMAIVRVFLVAAAVMVVLSILLAGTIAGPMRRLATAADKVRRGARGRGRETIPEFADRHDEIGHLARALKEMTEALYRRMDAIEAFAADVAHELKNPLTSLKSAVETLPLAKNEASRARLTDIVMHDVRRLNRLITDISDASRLDAELSRQDAGPVDLALLLKTVVEVQRGLAAEEGPSIELVLAPAKGGAAAWRVTGHDSRLGQVFTNLLDNARSFSPPGGTVTVTARREGESLVITVDDEGPGIRPQTADRIFERFYTDRPEQESFGNNSGLGLSISRQIVEAHDGTIRAENRLVRGGDGETAVAGARFTVQLPVDAG